MRTAATLTNRLKRCFFSSLGDIKLSSLAASFSSVGSYAVHPEMTDRIPGSSPLASLVSNTPSPVPPPASCELLRKIFCSPYSSEPPSSRLKQEFRSFRIPREYNERTVLYSIPFISAISFSENCRIKCILITLLYFSSICSRSSVI